MTKKLIQFYTHPTGRLCAYIADDCEWVAAQSMWINGKSIGSIRRELEDAGVHAPAKVIKCRLHAAGVSL